MHLWPTLALLTQLWSFPAFGAGLQCRDLPNLFESFEKHHYAVKEITPEVRARTVERFIDAIDPSRTLLLDADVSRLKKELPAIFERIEDGDCALLSSAFRLVIRRAEDDERLARSTLNDKYQLDESVELLLESDKRGWPKTQEERSALVGKMIHFQISNYLSAGLTLDAAKKQLIHRYELVTKRLRERDAETKLVGYYAEAFANALDPHSAFMSADTLADFQIQMKLSLEGIGAALSSQDGFTVIESLIPGGQADKVKKLQPKDKIIAVSQEGEKPVSTIDMELQEVVKMIRGKKGTKVTLTILREIPTSRTFDVTIVRDKIDVKEQAAKITYETRQLGDRTLKIGVIDLPSFYGSSDEGGRSSYADVKQLLEEAKIAKVDGIVLDLSKNGGGLLQDAVRISGLFIKRGAVVATRDSSGKQEVLADEDDGVAYAGPLAVLISPASASASEILAGALKDYRRAIIIGSRSSFGKGTVQILSPLPADRGAIKVTTGMFFLPSGASTQQTGVTSHIQVPSILDGFDVGEKGLHYSLPPQNTKPFLSNEANGNDAAKRWRPIDEKIFPELAKRSTDRVAKSPEMAEIKKQLAEAEANKGVVRLADLRKRAKENGGEKNGDEAKEKAKALEAAFVDEGVNILADLITLRA